MQKEAEEEMQQETRIEVEIPKITTNFSNNIHFVKLPNFLSVETRYGPLWCFVKSVIG